MMYCPNNDIGKEEETHKKWYVLIYYIFKNTSNILSTIIAELVWSGRDVIKREDWSRYLKCNPVGQKASHRLLRYVLNLFTPADRKESQWNEGGTQFFVFKMDTRLIREVGPLWPQAGYLCGTNSSWFQLCWYMKHSLAWSWGWKEVSFWWDFFAFFFFSQSSNADPPEKKKIQQEYGCVDEA